MLASVIRTLWFQYNLYLFINIARAASVAFRDRDTDRKIVRPIRLDRRRSTAVDSTSTDSSGFEFVGARRASGVVRGSRDGGRRHEISGAGDYS